MSRSQRAGTILLLAGILIGLLSCSGSHFMEGSVTPLHFKQLGQQAPGGLQLDPGVFMPPDSMTALGVDLGDVVLVIIDDARFEAHVYPYPQKGGVLGINAFTQKAHDLRLGDARIVVTRPAQPVLHTRSLEMVHEAYPGDTERWGNFVVSAPHGDCDLFTGEIVQRMNAEFGIPASAFYHPRFTFLGRWYDANRPLGKAPRPDGHGTIPERIWNEEIDSIFTSYRDRVRSAVDAQPGTTLDFVCSFHGHDLKMKDAEGNRINREVIEAYGGGFTLEQYRQMKSWFQQIAHRYYAETPLLVFGNLPEDQVYTIDGQDFNFWYTGLGTRAYGTLRRDNARYGLHMETPNSMRFDPCVREKTAIVMGEFFDLVKREMIQSEIGERPTTPPSSFKQQLISLPEAKVEYRNRQFRVPAFKLNRYETSVAEFTQFLNTLTDDPGFEVRNDSVYLGTDLINVLSLYAPGDQIRYAEGTFRVAEGRSKHPVAHVTWEGARRYAASIGGRLPTEVEWVRAAGWWDGEMHPYAVPAAGFNELIAKANVDNSEDAYETGPYPWTTPWGQNPPNPNGLADMSGNVWEWCSDWFHSQYFRDLPDSTLIADPQGPDPQTMRTIKGGAWTAGFEVSQTRYRVAYPPSRALPTLGFRVAWNVDE